MMLSPSRRNPLHHHNIVQKTVHGVISINLYIVSGAPLMPPGTVTLQFNG